MTNQDELIQLYNGSEINAEVLHEILEENQIASMIRNDMNSGLAAGFGGGLSGFAANVLVADKDLEKAKTILKDFLESLEDDEVILE